MPHLARLELKPIVGIAVAEESIGKAVENLRTYSSVCGMRWVGYVTALAKTPNQVSKDRNVERRLERLGKKLIGVLKV